MKATYGHGFVTPPPFHCSPPSSSNPPPTNNGSVVASTRRKRAIDETCLFQVPLTQQFKDGYLKVRKVKFTDIETIGRRKLPQQVIDHNFNHLRNKWVSLSDIMQGITNVNNWFFDHQYICSYVLLIKSQLFQHHKLSFLCIEPLLSQIKLISSEDETQSIKIKPHVILRCLGLKLGQVFHWDAINLKKLSSLNLFSFIDVQIEIVSNDKLILKIKLNEMKSKFIEPGIGFSSSNQMFGDLNIIDNNFRGNAQRMKFQWQKRLDAPKSTFGFAFEDLRVGAFIPISFRLRAYRDCNAVTNNNNNNNNQQRETINLTSASFNQQHDDDNIHSLSTVDLPLRYEKDRDGILFDIGYKPNEKSSLLFNVTPMFERIYSTMNNRNPNDGGLLQAILQTGFTHSTKKGRMELPRGGHTFRVEHIFGTPLTSSQHQRQHDDYDDDDNNDDDRHLSWQQLFHKVKIKIVHYFSVPSSTSSLATRFIAGVGTDNLPWHEQRALGGHATIRGYGYGELGRFKSYGTGRMEIRVPLAFNNNKEISSNNNGILEKMPALIGVVFGDAGLADVGRPIIVGSSYGLGVRVGGIIAVDWIRTSDGRPSRIHFSLVDRSF